jgi:transposase InsO family protein
MEVSRSAYYSYLKKKNEETINPDIRLIVELKMIHRKSNRSYGSRRMAKELSTKGYTIGRYKVRRLMRENGILCKQRRKYVVTTKSNHGLVTAKNILNRNFDTKKPNEAWVSDITYVWTNEGWLYIAVVLDLFSRRIVGWSMANHMRTDLVENAFIMAKLRRKPQAGLLHHSDRGIQYASQQYQQALQKAGAIVSMSRKGNCWDNAVMERFFGTLKSERTDGKYYQTLTEAKSDVINFIEEFYNKERLHSTLNYMSPAQYEVKSKIKSPACNKD